MSRPQNLLSPFLSFGNPFRTINQKGSYLSPKLLCLLNNFEATLSARLQKLKQVDKKEILGLSWMRSSMELLCATHTDIKGLINALELPVNEWEEKWVDTYLDDSVKLLDIFNGFSSEISQLKHGHLFILCLLNNLGDSTSIKFVRVRSSLDGWRQHINAKNPRLDNCFAVMVSLTQTLNLPQIKNSAKGKVLMRAMYGVKVVTLFICSVFAAAFSGSTKKLMDASVSETYLWAKDFTDLQMFVNTEIRNGCVSLVKELETVNMDVKKLYPIVQDGVDSVEAEALQSSASNLEKSAEKFSGGLDLLAREVDKFFHILLTGREALLCNLRIGGNVSDRI